MVKINKKGSGRNKARGQAKYGDRQLALASSLSPFFILPKKVRLDKLVFDRGLAETRTKAQALIMAGQVIAEDTTITKSGTMVEADISISIKKKNPYVSRGGLKLEHALKYMELSVKDKICLDIGASTGGFSDCLLQHGAKKVYAIDVGHNQLHYRLKNDPRIVSIEGVNFRYFSFKSLKDPIEFVTIDVSFISLEKILPNIPKNIVVGSRILSLVKPQFEAEAKHAKKGVVRDEAIRQKTIEKIKAFAQKIGLSTVCGVDSAIKGPKGNIEHFLLLEKP